MPAHDHSSFSSNEEEGYEDVQAITVGELKTLMDSGDDIVVLDVRDPHEWEIAAIDGTLRIPKGDIQAAKNGVLAGRKLFDETVLKHIPKDKPLYVHCRSGKRSADSILFLKEVGYDTKNMWNVAGGILAWAQQIDPTLPQY
jgi:adenylyltransferase/sulfurtransferase